MPTQSEIREAVEVLKESQDFLNKESDLLGEDLTNTKEYKATNVLLAVANSYLSITGLPAKRKPIMEITEDDASSNNITYGFNSALAACRLAILKKLDGLEEVIRNKLDLNCNCDCEVKPCLIHGDPGSVEDLSQAIKNHLLEEEKK